MIIPFLQLYPLPNAGLIGNGDTGIFATSLSQTFNENFVTARIDHTLSKSDNLFGTFLYDNGNLTIPDALNNAVFPNVTRRRVFAIEETHTFNQNLVNSIRFGFSRTAGDVNIAGAALNQAAALTTLGSAPN
ncbi:MAG: hypothetical protein ABJA66_16865, partial [Actinomycetota bacterium]